MLSIEECVRDSPHFRSKLQAHLQVVLEFEQLLLGMTRSIDELSRAGNSYGDALGQFSSVLKSFSIHFDRGVVKDAFLVFHDVIKKVQTNFNILQDQVKGSFMPELTKFSLNEVRKVRDSRKVFDRSSDQLLTAVNKSVSASRQKPVEAEEASRNLETARGNFSHQSVELAFQINLLAAKKQPFLLEHVISHLESQCYFYKVANGLLQDFRPNLSKYSFEMEPIQQSMIESLKQMNNRKDVVNTCIEMERQSADFQIDPRNPKFEGFLLKKKSKSAFKQWNRRYFMCRDFRLCYQNGERKQIAVEDLKLCTVKLQDEFDRRFCFEVVTPSKTLMLQAETERERNRWCEILQACFLSNLNSPIDKNSPETAFHIVRTKFKGQSQFTEKLRAVPGNELCADCCHPEATWSSVNLGVILCIECSGIHRGLGVRVSKVRSLLLDQWEPECQKLMMQLGNMLINSIYEAYVPLGWVKPVPEASRKERVRWISAKYKYHYFVGPSLRSFVDVTVDPLDLPRSQSTEILDVDCDTSSVASFSTSGAFKKKRSPFKLPFLQSKPRQAVGEGLALKQRPKSYLAHSHLSLHPEVASLRQFREPMGSLDKRTTLAAHSAFRRSFNHPGSSNTLPPPKPPRSMNRHSLSERSTLGIHAKVKAGKVSSLDLSFDNESSSSSNSVHSAGGQDQVPQILTSDDTVLGGEDPPPIPPPPFGSLQHQSTPAVSLQRTGSVIASMHKPFNDPSPDFDLYQAAQLGDVPMMARALAEGAHTEYQNPRGLGATPLIRSTLYGNLMASEFLMQNGASINTKDWNDQTALHHASKMGKTGHVCLFLKRGANKDYRDNRGKDALSLALEEPHADIVTLLRLSQLNDNMRGEQEELMGDSVSVVFDDFSDIAVKDPERLKRVPSPRRNEPADG